MSVQIKRKKFKSGPRYLESEMQMEILKAWAGGERTIDEVVKMTKYTYKQVRRYLPETKNG